MLVSFDDLVNKKEKIAVAGLGYVGLPLAVLLAKRFSVIGFDANAAKISDLTEGIDRTGEVPPEALAAANIEYSADPGVLRQARFIILAIPTPIDANKKPDLHLVRAASETVGRYLAPGAVVVYESTVYPGVTEEICAPILERASGLKCGRDFGLAYSPERVNPGDREHTIERIVKVVSAMDEETLALADRVYGSVIKAGTYRAATIKTAEAAKAIENTQRDLNIALVNELSMIFNRMGIDTHAVLKAAGTKWNFLNFVPGLVGGHCIGVDPYYLTHRAESLGYHPEVILAGRRINDGMGAYVARETVKRLARSGLMKNGTRVAILGFTFKENVPDIRNSKVIDIYRELKEYGLDPLVYDPLADRAEVAEEYDLGLADWGEIADLDALIIAVPHERFRAMKIADYRRLLKDGPVFIADLKRVLDPEAAEAAGINYWSL